MKIKETKAAVDWHVYAEKYDMLLAYNPFYQEARQRILEEVKQWEIEPGGTIADVGAGTGNFSVEVAQLYPRVTVLHIENNTSMNAVAAKKAATLDNLLIRNLGIEAVDLAPESLGGLLCINAIYTFPEPRRVLAAMNNWLAPGARIALVDPGRIMNVFAWQVNLGWHLLKTYGWATTRKIFREAEAVSKQNANIREMQKNGAYWTHTHEQFCQAVEQAGFRIERAETCFRGDCDLVIAQKTK